MCTFGGERGRNRTYNLVIKSHLLCQLSYAPACGVPGGLAAPARIERRAARQFRIIPSPAPPRTQSMPPQSARCPAVSAASGSRRRSASRNIVWQNGQAVPTTAAPVAASSVARSTFTRLPFSSPRNICPPPAPQQNDRSRARARIRHLARPRDHLARLVVNAAIAAQVARIVENHALAPVRRAAAASPASAPATRYDARSGTPRRIPSSPRR